MIDFTNWLTPAVWPGFSWKWCLKKAQKVTKHLGYFGMNIVIDNFQKSPNLVTLDTGLFSFVYLPSTTYREKMRINKKMPERNGRIKIQFKWRNCELLPRDLTLNMLTRDRKFALTFSILILMKSDLKSELK